MTLLDTPEGIKAVEAANSKAANPDSVNGDCGCDNCVGHRKAILLAALPHLRRAIAEELRAEAEKAELSTEEYVGWQFAANFLGEGT